MKKITTILMMLLVATFGFAQELPLDFEDASIYDGNNLSPFGGATASVVEDPTDNTNSVLELAGNGTQYDGVKIAMSTYIDLSDDNTNTITFEFWAPDANSRTHLLKFEGGTSGAVATELQFTSNTSGWQTISVDFTDAGLSDDYPLMAIFPDFANTDTGTYYIDDIDGPNGAVVPVDPIPAGPAPVPTSADGETYSIYNDTNNYTTSLNFQNAFGTLSGEPDLDPSSTVNKALKFNFGVAGWGHGQGPDDVSAYDFVSFDYWAGAGVVGFDFVMISNDGAVSEYKYQISIQEAIVNETWTRVEIPMSYFTKLGFADTALFQWKADPLNGSVDNNGIVYMDNILLTQNTTLSNTDFVQAEFKAYPNPARAAWTIQTTEDMKAVQVYNISGSLVRDLEVNASKTVISTEGLSSGVYLAKISNGSDQTKTIKLIKE